MRERGPGFIGKMMPKTANNLWDAMVSWDCLVEAYRRCAKGKRYKGEALRFGVRWEEELIELQQLLLWDMWRPRPMRSFSVYRPKTRLIEAPDFRDRIVHHALAMACEPLFERRFIAQSYACRKGKGTHKATAHVQAMLRDARKRWGRVYVLQCDVRKYFPSIDHQRLLRQISRAISDPKVLQVWWRSIERTDQASGLPVGSLTSQMAGNAYLDPFDHWIKDDLGFRHYARYMDDWIVLGPCKAALHDLREEVRQRLATELALTLHPKSRVYPASEGVDFCGYRTWTTHILPRKRNLLAARRRLRRLGQRYAAGEVGRDRIDATVASFLGYTKHCSAGRSAASILAELEDAMGCPLAAS